MWRQNFIHTGTCRWNVVNTMMLSQHNTIFHIRCLKYNTFYKLKKKTHSFHPFMTLALALTARGRSFCRTRYDTFYLRAEGWTGYSWDGWGLSWFWWLWTPIGWILDATFYLNSQYPLLVFKTQPWHSVFISDHTMNLMSISVYSNITCELCNLDSLQLIYCNINIFPLVLLEY